MQSLPFSSAVKGHAATRMSCAPVALAWSAVIATWWLLNEEGSSLEHRDRDSLGQWTLDAKLSALSVTREFAEEQRKLSGNREPEGSEE